MTQINFYDQHLPWWPVDPPGAGLELGEGGWFGTPFPNQDPMYWAIRGNWIERGHIGKFNQLRIAGLNWRVSWPSVTRALLKIFGLHFSWTSCCHTPFQDTKTSCKA